jgi:hypothetical protein
MKGAVWITEGEWQALNLGSRALREVGAALTRSGAGELAAESYLSAAALEGLGRRAVIETARDHDGRAEIWEAER